MKLFRLVAFALLVIGYAGNSAAMTDYTEAKVTGVGLYINGSALKFTLDKTDSQNLVWTTDNYTGDQLKHLIALIMMAYTTGTKVAFIRTFDTIDSSTKYIKVAQFELGKIVH